MGKKKDNGIELTWKDAKGNKKTFAIDDTDRNEQKAVFLLTVTDLESNNRFHVEGLIVGSEEMIISALAQQLTAMGPEFCGELLYKLAEIHAENEGGQPKNLAELEPTSQHLM